MVEKAVNEMESADARARNGRNGKQPHGGKSSRSTLLRLTAVAVVTAAVGVFALGSAGADTPQRDSVEILDLAIQNDQYAETDLGPAGPSLGDTSVYSGGVLQGGRKVGLGGGSCHIVHIAGEKRTTQCLITLNLEQGSLTMQSLAEKGASSLDMAITGGTGAYSTARGTVRYWDIATPNERLRARILR
ncbi:allene oxide cyclase barrel-like domain-containing protein [Streptomyces sp. 796.1]|uniref:allene oxide cyclase barrel-like domain-containing protein n=1 Tax=Streptomyces sp. 796.1 TaxID=3163029 RepID=UPI0039C94A5D